MRPTVLIVANPYDGEVLRRALAAAGYDTRASDGRGELSALLDPRPSAVVLTLRLSRADARAILGAIRALEDGSDLPVLLIGERGSAASTPSAARAMGADYLLLRPIEPTLVVDKLQHVLGLGSPAGERQAPVPAPAPASDEPRPLPPLIEARSTERGDETARTLEAQEEGEPLLGEEGERGGRRRERSTIETFNVRAVRSSAASDGGRPPDDADVETATERAGSAAQRRPPPRRAPDEGPAKTAVPPSGVVRGAGQPAVAEGSEPDAFELALPRAGQLSTVDTAHLLALAHRSGHTGRLALTRGQVKKVVVLDKGRPVFALSSEPHDRMTDLLLREGKITREQFESCQQELSRSQRRVGAVLVDMGLLKPGELFPLVRHHVAEIVYSLFAWADGRFSFVSQERIDGERIRLEVEPRALILEGIRRKLGLDQLVERVGPPETRVVLHHGGIQQLREAGARRREQGILELMDGRHSLREIGRRSGEGQLAAYQLAYAAIVLGAGSARAPGRSAGDVGLSAETARQRDLGIDRKRIEAKWAQVCEGDYFSLLGLRRDASSHEVERAYERMSREFQLGSFSEPLLEEWAEQLVEIGEVIEESYRVLCDDERRAAYRRSLS